VSLTDDQRRAVQSHYAAATRSGDVHALDAISEPDAVVWHNHDDITVTAQQSSRTLAWLHRTVPDVAWEDVAVLTTSDGFIWRALLTGNAPGGPIRVHTCAIVALSESGKVRRTDEYLDAGGLAALIGDRQQTDHAE
jgi:ketosteroid isomerase-like protein